MDLSRREITNLLLVFGGPLGYMDCSQDVVADGDAQNFEGLSHFQWLLQELDRRVCSMILPLDMRSESRMNDIFHASYQQNILFPGVLRNDAAVVGLFRRYDMA